MIEYLGGSYRLILQASSRHGVSSQIYGVLFNDRVLNLFSSDLPPPVLPIVGW